MLMADPRLRRSCIVTWRHASIWTEKKYKLAFPVRLLQQTCPYLSTPTLSTLCRSMNGQQQQEGFAKLLLDSRVAISHNAKYNYANLFFQWVQHKIMALIYTLTSSKSFVCKLAMISGMEMRSVSCIHLLLPGGLGEICYGLLTWELLIRTETKPCVELD